MYAHLPLGLGRVEDLLFERGTDICHDTVRIWWNKFGPMFAGEVRRHRVSGMHLARSAWRGFDLLSVRRLLSRRRTSDQKR